LGKWIDPSSANLEALVSYALADNLNLGLFNYGGGMSVSVPSKNKTNSFFKKNFSSSFYMISGIFNSSDPVDQKTIFTSVSSAQKLLGLGKESVSSIIVKTTSNSNLSYVSSKIKDIVGDKASVKTRKELNETYYKMLNSEELILNFVLGLILIVAMFNTIGAVIILVIEKKKNIKTLHKLGAYPADIRQVFFKHGLLLSYSGGSIGLLIGCLIVFLQEKFSLIYLAGTSIPYPVVFDYKNFFIVSFWIFVVGYFGSFISSKSVNKIKL
jgi:lipoprotein-releasing system permease protein